MFYTRWDSSETGEGANATSRTGHAYCQCPSHSVCQWHAAGDAHGARARWPRHHGITSLVPCSRRPARRGWLPPGTRVPGCAC
eukprot:1647163-Rhodomonas_salina.1